MFPHLNTVISTALRFHLFTASLSSPCHSLLNHCVQRPSQKGFVCHWRLLDPHFRTMVASRFYQAQTRPSSSASAPTWGTLCGCRSDGIRIWVGEALWAQQWEVMDSSPMCHLPDPACVFSSLMVAFEQIDCQSDCPVWVTGAKWQRVELGSLWMFSVLGILPEDSPQKPPCYVVDSCSFCLTVPVDTSVCEWFNSVCSPPSHLSLHWNWTFCIRKLQVTVSDVQKGDSWNSKTGNCCWNVVMTSSRAVVSATESSFI